MQPATSPLQNNRGLSNRGFLFLRRGRATGRYGGGLGRFSTSAFFPSFDHDRSRRGGLFLDDHNFFITASGEEQTSDGDCKNDFRHELLPFRRFHLQEPRCAMRRDSTNAMPRLTHLSCRGLIAAGKESFPILGERMEWHTLDASPVARLSAMTLENRQPLHVLHRALQYLTSAIQRMNAPANRAAVAVDQIIEIFC